MTLMYKEGTFPVEYREAEVRHIMSALYRLRSINVSGLAGMGKSNLVRFILSHPQVRPRYLKERADDYAFVHVDCAGLAEDSEAEILIEMAVQLQRDPITKTSLAPSLAPPGIRRALKDLLLGVDPGLNLVLVLDYFDQVAAKLAPAFFNYLFHLRNSRPRGNLAYVFVTRRPLGHLYELQELLDAGCIVGPLTTQDALDSLRRDEVRLGCTFSPAQREALIACTGGHPGLMKNGAELAASGKVDVGASGEETARQLLQSEQVINLCRELWNDLAPGEQAILLNVARAGRQGDKETRRQGDRETGRQGEVRQANLLSVVRGVPGPGDAADMAFLERNGILVRRGAAPGEPGVAIFCPLFKVFVRQVVSATAGAVRIAALAPNQARIETVTGEEQVPLPPRVFALLLALTEGRGQVLTADALISRVYGHEAAGVTDAALSQLVKRLREALDPPARRMANDPAYESVETIRSVGYRLNG